MRWKRNEDTGTSTKRAKMPDGEVSYLLLAREGKDEGAVLDAAYPSLEKIYEKRQKSISLMLISFALLVLSYLDFVDEFGSAGLKVNPIYLKHFALMFSCVAGLNYALVDGKMSYFQTIFAYIFDRSDARGRADLLARFPLAFDVNQFSPTVRGYPKFVFPKRFHQFYPWAALSLVGLAAILLLSMFISVSIAIDVWNSEGQVFVSRSIVIISAYTGLISLFVPKYWNIKRLYTHYGSSELFRQLDERNPARAKIFRRITVGLGLKHGLIRIPKD
jgi:hypothetical protein